METTPQLLAESDRACLTAPAGCGKTHIIAMAVDCHQSGRQLLLTHTHAGVRAMKTRLTKLQIPSCRYRVETISGFSLRYVSSYPRLSSVQNLQPCQNTDWSKVYRGAQRLFLAEPIRKVILESYAGVYVDEYQDCTLDQHGLVMALADTLPCRVLGDPLQGIFEFRHSQCIDWERDVISFFDELPPLSVPHRWTNTRSGFITGSGL